MSNPIPSITDSIRYSMFVKSGRVEFCTNWETDSGRQSIPVGEFEDFVSRLESGDYDAIESLLPLAGCEQAKLPEVIALLRSTVARVIGVALPGDEVQLAKDWTADEVVEDEKLETIKIDFHGLMDLCGIYSEDRFSKKWHYGIQPANEYFDVIDNEDGTFLVRGTPESLEPARGNVYGSPEE